MNEETTTTLPPETTEPKRTAGRPRKVSLDDDDGLLDEALKVQRSIMNDQKANAATRERAAGEVRELIKQRQQRRDDEAKGALTAEVTRLRGEVERLTAQVNELQLSALGKVDASEVATMKSELVRLRSESVDHGARMTTLQANRDAVTTALKYAVQTLGPDGSARAAMKLLIDGKTTKSLLELFGVDAEAWLRCSGYKTKEQLLQVFRLKKTDSETDLTRYCRFRLSVEFQIDDVAAELSRIAEAEETERRAATRRMIEEMRNGG